MSKNNTLIQNVGGLLLILCFFYGQNAAAQYKPVVFNYEKNYFNQGQTLPAENYFLLNGQIPLNIDLVEFKILPSRSLWETVPLYTAIWKRSIGSENEIFEVPVNYKLKGGYEYDFQVSLYRAATTKEIKTLQSNLQQDLGGYIDGFLVKGFRKHPLDETVKQIMKTLNDLVSQDLILYRNKVDYEFQGFSVVVENKVRELKAVYHQNLTVFTGKDERTTQENSNLSDARKVAKTLKKQVFDEVTQLLNLDLLMLADHKVIVDYPVEYTRNVVKVNAGVGGVYFAGELDDLVYDGSPYLGLSFPLGRSAFSGTFWSQSSISVGAFIENFMDENGYEVTGPVFGRPYYLGFGYKLFQSLRLNAGATILETKTPTNPLPPVMVPPINPDVNNIRVRPFVGISVEVQLWMGFGNR